MKGFVFLCGVLRGILLLLFPLIYVSSQAQIPEMLNLLPDSFELSQYSPLEKAKVYYEKGEYSKAESLFLQELDLGRMSGNDFLLFANCLMAQNKKALAREMFNEYKRISNITYGPVADMISSLFRSDSSERLIRRDVEESLGVCGTNFFDGKIYGSIEGNIISFNAGCTGEIGSLAYVNTGESGMKISSVCYYNGGFSAILSVFRAKEGTYALYTTEREGAEWSKPKAIGFTVPFANYLHPYFDESRGILYFSSDMEGGQGGFDIYLSNYKKGKFSDPINLGSTINTFGNELYPNYQGDWLYFSSTGYPGLGGYDIYKYRSVDDYAIIKNYSQVNGNAHDMKVYVQDNKHLVVQSANRLQLCSFHKKLSAYEGTVINIHDSPLANAAVLQINGEEKYSYQLTDKEGKFRFYSTEDDSLKVRVMVDGFYTKDFTLSREWDNVITLELIQNIEIVKVVKVDSMGDELQARFYVGSPNDSTLLDEQFNEAGHDHVRGVFKPKGDMFYVVVGSATDYDNAYKIWSTHAEQFPGLQIIQFGDRLYRIGFEAGTNELEAVSALRDAIDQVSDAWLIRPGTY